MWEVTGSYCKFVNNGSHCCGWWMMQQWQFYHNGRHFLIQKEQNMSLKAAILPIGFGKHCSASQLAHTAVLLAGICLAESC